MATTVRIPSALHATTGSRARVAVEGATVGKAPTHPIDELRAARRDLLAALQGCTAADLLRPGMQGERCGRDVLLHLATGLRQLAHLVPDLAIHGYQRGEPVDPRPRWAAGGTAQRTAPGSVRPEAAVASVVTAHARLLAALEGLDDADLRRRGATRFGCETSGWELLRAEAAREREHAARLVAHTRQPPNHLGCGGAAAAGVAVQRPRP